MDSVPAHPRRAGSARSGGSRSAWPVIYTVSHNALPLAGLGRAGFHAAAGHQGQRLGIRSREIAATLEGVEEEVRRHPAPEGYQRSDSALAAREEKWKAVEREARE